ncbi:hypothetical protein FRC14_007321 [Serendipita sp. 396]|nr:hypothetical protein FRC14_007321 [Serendipita sp. 396]
MQFDKTHDAWFYVNTVAHPPTTTWEHPAANADALQTQTYEAPASSGPPAATGNMGGNIDFSRESALVVCDMQEEYRRSVHHFSSVLATAVRMIRFAKLVGVQVFLTKGRPSIYGSTVHEIEHEIAQLPPGLFGGSFTKTKFLGDSVELTDSLRSKRFRHAMFCGVEAHIGVRAQATELLKQGMIVHVLLDGISSRNKEEVSPFITLMRQPNNDRLVLFSIRIRQSLNEFNDAGNLKVPVGDFLTDFLALIRTEGQSISTGLKTLLGNGDERVLGESSEVIE